MGFLHHYPDIPDRIVGGLFLLAQSLSVTTTESCAGELTLDSILRLIFRCFRSIRHFPHRLKNRGILLLTFAWRGSGISVSDVVLAVLLLPPALSGR